MKKIMGIITIVLFFIVILQGCASDFIDGFKDGVKNASVQVSFNKSKIAN